MNRLQHQQDWQVTKSTIRERFMELLTLSQWTDCSFVVGEDNIEIKCHKLVLAVSSPVFEALFFGSLSSPNNDPVIVPDIEPPIFKMLLNYMYSDCLNLHSVEEAGGLLYAAKKYLIQQLSRLCLEYLLERTFIQNLWDILAIAESLDEEELIEAVFKIMCRFGTHIWYSKSEHLSPQMLKRLLDESNMNITEEQLWSIVLDWAKKDCLSKGLVVNGSHLRNALKREKLLERIRFLTFCKEKFRKNVAETEILTELEVDTILKAMDADDQHILHIDSSDTKSNKMYDFPGGLCSVTKKRRLVKRVPWRCVREKSKIESMWICCDQFICAVTSHNRVLVTSFEVPTRSIYSSRECYPWMGTLHYHPAGSYNEKFSVAITDEEGLVLSSTSYSAWVPYDSIQVVTLDEEVWFYANKSYYIVIELSSGAYELFNLSGVAHSKGTVFSFNDSSEHSRSDVFCGSFVTAISYYL